MHHLQTLPHALAGFVLRRDVVQQLSQNAGTPDIRRKIGEGLREIQKGMVLGMPKSRPMPDVAPGVAELRVKDAGITTRVFYITKVAELIIVFHGFAKDSSKTPRREIELGKKRLKEILDGKV